MKMHLIIITMPPGVKIERILIEIAFTSVRWISTSIIIVLSHATLALRRQWLPWLDFMNFMAVRLHRAVLFLRNNGLNLWPQIIFMTISYLTSLWFKFEQFSCRIPLVEQSLASCNVAAVLSLFSLKTSG